MVQNCLIFNTSVPFDFKFKPLNNSFLYFPPPLSHLCIRKNPVLVNNHHFLKSNSKRRIGSNSIIYMNSHPESPLGRGRVLSIQSHTVRGYVGNKCAVFPLQLLGFDVDPINSVQFSNHTGYPSWKGQVLNGDQLWDLIQGLESNDLLFYTHLLTGYIGSVSFLETILKVVEKLRTVNPNLIYVCDPVMGDEGRLYINPQLVPIYREKVIPISTLITPNQFEIENLTGIKINNENDAIKACQHVHKLGPSKIIITSMNLNEKLLTLIGSERMDDNSNSKIFRIQVPKLPFYFTGTGDLLTALLLGWSHKYPNNLSTAAELAIASLQAVLLRTVKDYESNQVNSSIGKLELGLIQGRDDIILPHVKILSESISLDLV